MNSGHVKRMVMQPTSLCNLGCTYCYLAHRKENRKMSLLVAEAVAKSIEDEKWDVLVNWHGGEPLSCGISHFRSLLVPFESLRLLGRVVHAVQTNATLINDDWCTLFRENSIHIGVSIDGPQWANLSRVNLGLKESYPSIMRGIDFLKKHRIPFTVICVVGEWSLGGHRSCMNFSVNSDASRLGLTLKKKEGYTIHRRLIVVS